MGLRRDRQYCYAERKPCTAWAMLYFKDCLCNLRDEVSFGLGLLSVTCWAFAEVPQIVTNFRAKSSQGVSLLLLLTWILGDAFNLVGCALEPSTLPTQFYTALLYTVGSVILVSQCIYYDRIVPWLRNTGKRDRRVVALEEAENSVAEPLLCQKHVGSGKEIDYVQGAHPVPRSPAYYTSARSLATSPSASTFEARFLNSVGEQNTQNSPSKAGSFISQSRRVVNVVVGYGTFVAAANLPDQARAYRTFHRYEAMLLPIGKVADENRSDLYGQLMGWGMAVIYISGRLPQIWLNMKRGNVEGLSPLMFIFALAGNITYVLSILVRSCKWIDIKANMPWLLDALFCVSLDLFILLQFIYYRYKWSKRNRCSHLPEARDILA
uniref:Uncharacterized protein n=1 Tax=Kalanchoe fedtschenkoi TaxID=63787 RepID=A0A7N1A727_KALFE